MTLLKPDLKRRYPTATKAEGSRIYDAYGREWIDASSGAIASAIGHAHPDVIRSVTAALEQTSFVYRTQFTNQPAERLARRLCEKLGYSGAFFVNSGSEAVEAAVRTALQFWRERGKPGKLRVISRRISYHGATSAALGLSGHWPRRRAAGPLMGEPTQPTPYCLRCPLGQHLSSCGLACASVLEQEIGEHGKDAIAAFILEPITGASGAAIVPPPDYLRRIREICDRYDILLIADEVLTGLGRTGAWLAMDHGGVKADIVCLGKGLNGGYLPLSAVMISEPIHHALRDGSGSFALGHTHSNHPVASAAGNAVLDVLERDDLVTRAQIAGSFLGQRLRELADRHMVIGDVRGAGMLWGLELVRDRLTKEPFAVSDRAADSLVNNAFDLGLVVYPATGFANAKGGDAILVAPPLNVTHEDVLAIVEVLERAIVKTFPTLSCPTEESDAA